MIAAVDGVATAAGCQLVAACDLAIATESSTFATPGVRIGLFCSTPMVPISRAVGRKRAMQMLLTGNPISAQTAADWGLVNTVVPSADLDAAVAAMAADIVRWSSHTIAIGKGAFYDQLDRSEPDAYDLTKRIMSANAIDEVAQEGIDAFLEKRDRSGRDEHDRCGPHRWSTTPADAAWAALGKPGAQWTGAERVAIADLTRRAAPRPLWDRAPALDDLSPQPRAMPCCRRSSPAWSNGSPSNPRRCHATTWSRIAAEIGDAAYAELASVVRPGRLHRPQRGGARSRPSRAADARGG